MSRHPTEQKILDEAIRLIDERGEAGVRIQDIQNAVSVTPPSIYHFFGSREGLVCEAQAARLYRSFVEMDDVLDGILAKVTTRDEMREAIRIYIRTIFDASRELERLRRVATVGSVEGRPDQARRFSEVIRGYVAERGARLAVLQERGVIDSNLDVEAFTFWVMGVIFGRTLAELGGDPGPLGGCDELTERVMISVMLGED